MLKLNASFSKKVPAEVEFSSKGYSATIEVELPDGLTQDQLQKRIHSTFKLVEESVETEINGSANDTQNVNENTEQLNHQRTEEVSTTTGQKNNKNATAKQLKYLSDLAQKKNVNIYACLRDFGYRELEQLRFDECSLLINKFKGINAA